MTDPVESGRQPMFRAPWPPVALAAAVLALYALQSVLGVEKAADALGLTPVEVAHGRHLWTLVTSQFLHLGWAHVGLNALGLVAFGSGVARLFGVRAVGAALFLAVYLACGVAAGLTEVLAHPRGAFLVVGASGAVSGLVGGVSRLRFGERRLLPFASRQVVAMAAAWVAGNLAVGWAGLDRVGAGTPVAWEAHLGGYGAGLILVGPALALARRLQAG